ncbi:RNase H family protein [Aspergillus niger]|uniref:RNase H family protein n=1 Tax=Aspergillus niger TaxID=5061 RepID=A0A505IE60_ASPNG|nr:RNase H family protein [Aspergillus niger]
MSISETAKAAECSKQAVKYIRSNLRVFGSPRAPPTRVGRARLITPVMLEALCEHLLEKPGLYLDEMAMFLWDEFGLQVATSSISRALSSVGWSKKTVQQKAKEQNPDLRDEYIHEISEFKSYQLVFVDESGCDKRIGFRRTGWAPSGIAPVQVSRFHRDKRYQILPAYSQDGVVLFRIFNGTTDAVVFEEFIEDLLRYCRKYPEERSVLVMDNAAFHHSERVEQLCSEKGVKLIFLPPYSPDLNPIEEFFAELKAFIRRHWYLYEEDPSQGFENYLAQLLGGIYSLEEMVSLHLSHGNKLYRMPQLLVFSTENTTIWSLSSP